MSALKKAVGFLKPLWVYTEKSLPVLFVLFSTLLIVAVWWFGSDWVVMDTKPLETTLAKSVATLSIILVLLFVFTVVLIRRNQAMNRDREVAEKDQEDPIRPYERRFVDQLNSTLALMKKSIASRNYIYALPWYVVMGEEDAGKTSLINRSGQKFSLTTVERTKKRYERSEANFKIDWWIGNDAVLIDPDGELITQQVISEEKLSPQIQTRLWDQFIKWLLEVRSNRPLNGIVLVIDLPKLIKTSPSNRQAMAGVFRARIQEMIEQLGTRLPVYVVFNKIDLLKGFEEVFSHLKDFQREENFGFSFSLKSREVDDWTQEFEAQFEGFIKSLNEIVFDHLSETNDYEERAAVYGFSRQLDGMKEILFQYLADILESDRFSTPAITRGVYFTSLFQQGVPRNLINLNVSAYYNVPMLMPTALPDLKQVTYFSSKLFYDIIYPEAGLAGDNIKITRRKKIVFAASSLVAILGGSMVLAGWQYYYNQNKNSADQVIKLTSQFSGEKIAHRIDPTGKELLAPMSKIRSAALSFGDYRKSIPVFEDMGLYQGNKIGQKIDVAYKEILSKKFLPAIAVGLVDEMNLAESGSDKELEVLRVYRMLEDKDNRNKDVAVNWMKGYWQSHFPNDGKTQRELLSHFSYAMDNVETDLGKFDSFIRRKQHELKQTPLERRVYRGIKQQANAELYFKMDLRNQIGPAFDFIYAHEDENNRALDDKRFSIDAFYTVEGFKDYFVPQSESAMDLALIDAWVLGQRTKLDYSEEDQKSLINKVRSIYVSDYINAWRQGLNELKIVDFRNIPHAARVIETITSSENPFGRLLETVEKQTTPYPVLPETETEANKLLLNDPNRQAASKITRSFSTLVELLKSKEEKTPFIEEVMQSLGDVHAYLKGIQDAPDMGKASLQAVKDRLTLTGIDPIFALKRVSDGLPSPMNAQVNAISKNAWKVLLVTAIEELEKKWNSDVYSFYAERIQPKYPFSKASRSDVSIQDFEEFFGPKGRLQTFYNDYLKLFLEENKGVLTFGDQSLVRDDFIDNLQAAWDIQDSFFDNNNNLHVEFSVEPLGLSSVFRKSVINVDGQLVVYSHGPSYPTRLIWPNSLRESTVSKLTLVSSSDTEVISRNGTWSWFRLLDQAQLRGATSKSIDLLFAPQNGKMRYRLTAEDKNNPFIRTPFNDFALPRKLLTDFNIIE